MRRLQSPSEVVFEYLSLPGRIVVDVGCGTGDLVRQMADRGASALGIDTAQMLEKTERYARTGEKYLIDCAEALPLPDHNTQMLFCILRVFTTQQRFRARGPDRGS